MGEKVGCVLVVDLVLESSYPRQPLSLVHTGVVRVPASIPQVDSP